MQTGKNYIKTIIAFTVAFIIQTTMLWHISFDGYSPNILLAMVVVFSFMFKENYGLVMGIAFGFLLDFSTGIYWGVSSICFILIFLLAALLSRVFNHEHIIIDTLISIPATLIYSFVYWGIYKLAGDPVTVDIVLESLPVLIVSNLIMVFVIHLILMLGFSKNKQDKDFNGEFTYTKGLE